jgi:hypothetical protein
MENKVCNKCGETLTLSSEFWYFHKNGKPHYPCKQCSKNSSKEWGKANKEKRKHTSKLYYETNKDKIIACNTEWQKNNREKSNQYKNKWKEENPEAMQAARKAWKEANPLKLIQYKSKSKAILAGLTEHYTEQDILELEEEQDMLCYYCGDIMGKYHIEHKTPLSRGCSNTKENLVLSCAACNYEKWAKTEEEYEAYKNTPHRSRKTKKDC